MKKSQRKYVINGFVKEIKQISRQLSYLTIEDFKGEEKRLPFYSQIPKRYQDGVATITAERKGTPILWRLTGRKFRQEIHGVDQAISIETSYRRIKKLRKLSNIKDII